jgi:hypothetical protein
VEEELPLLDRVAIRIAFTQLLQFNSAGRRASEPAVFAAAAAAAADSRQEQEQELSMAASGVPTVPRGGARVRITQAGPLDGTNPFRAAAAQAVLAKAAVQGKLAARDATAKGLEMLRSIPLPVIQRSQDVEAGAGPKAELGASLDGATAASAEAAGAEESTTSYELTQQEERLVQVSRIAPRLGGL